MLLVNFQPLALPVGRVGAANLRPFGPVQAQPAQVLDELRFVARLAPLHIGVFDAQQKISSGVAGKKPVVECGAGITDVQHPCG